MTGLFLFKIIRAAITPGTQTKQVSIKTIAIDPHPLSRTARGGKITDRKIWRQPVYLLGLLAIMLYNRWVLG